MNFYPLRSRWPIRPGVQHRSPLTEKNEDDDQGEAGCLGFVFLGPAAPCAAHPYSIPGVSGATPILIITKDPPFCLLT